MELGDECRDTELRRVGEGGDDGGLPGVDVVEDDAAVGEVKGEGGGAEGGEPGELAGGFEGREAGFVGGEEGGDGEGNVMCGVRELRPEETGEDFCVEGGVEVGFGDVGLGFDGVF